MADTYAIVETGGKQYRAEEGGSLLVDRLTDDEGAKISLRAVMFTDGDNTIISGADLEKIKVEAKVSGHERGPKIRVATYKSKKGARKTKGHRSMLTRLEVTGVSLLSRKPAAKKAEPKKADEAADAPADAAEAKPAAKKPAAKKPAAKKPAAKKAPAKKPAAAAKKPAAKKAPAKKKPATKKETD